MLTGFMNSIKIKGFLVAFLLIVCNLGFSQQNLSFKAMLDTNKILIGDQVALRIMVTHSNKIKVSFPSFKDSITSGIEVLSEFPVDTIEKKDGQVALSKAYLLTSFDTGSYTIPESKILLLVDGAKPDTLITDSLSLRVNTVAVDTTKADVKDIKPPIEAPLSFSEVAPWIFGGLGILAFIALVVWLIIRRIQHKPLLTISKPEEPADVAALRLLTELRQEKIWQNNHFKLYHSRLTEILRVYIYRVLQVNALEQTSDEVLHSLSVQNTISAENQNLLRTIFTVADLTKFAKHTPSAIENEESINLAEAFVRNTRPTPAVAVQPTSDNQNEESKPVINSSN